MTYQLYSESELYSRQRSPIGNITPTFCREDIKEMSVLDMFPPMMGRKPLYGKPPQSGKD